MPRFNLNITTPERNLFAGEVEQVSLPTSTGEITILAHHATLVSVLVPGELRFVQSGTIHPLAIGGGFVEIQQNTVHVLADTAERVEEIDAARAEEAKKRAEAVMAEKRGNEEMLAETAALLERNLARLKIIKKHRTRHTPHID